MFFDFHRAWRLGWIENRKEPFTEDRCCQQWTSRPFTFAEIDNVCGVSKKIFFYRDPKKKIDKRNKTGFANLQWG